ncbi:MAG: outer membrane protein transport protein [Shimia sp.]
MKKFLATSALVACAAAPALAGGIERSANNYGVLFEPGDYVEFGFSSVNPSVSGQYPAALGGGSTGNLSESYTSLSLSYKNQLTDTFALGLYANQPYGADALYTQGAYTGLSADWNGRAISLIGKYSLNNGFSVYGGARYSEAQAAISIPDLLVRGGLAAAGRAGNTAAGALAAGAPAGALTYTANTDTANATNFILGAAYERPEIALRVSFTYESGSDYDFRSTESVAAAPTISAAGDQRFTVKVPESYKLDFRTGVAPQTLLFGSVQYADWSVFDVRPDGYAALTGGQRVTGLDNDVWTYQLGVGRALSDDLRVFARIGYEAGNGGVASRLTPTDGKTSFGFGGTYQIENVKLTGGIEYVQVGDATDGSGTRFTGNDAIGLGLSVGFSF